MGEENGGALEEELGVIHVSLPFLILVLGATVASFYALLLQREGALEALKRGSQARREEERIFLIRRAAGAVFVGALGFFLCLNLSLAQQLGEGAGEAALRSSRVNIWASILVLCAAILRFFTLEPPGNAAQGVDAQEEDILPV